jgi:hypothetical protein
MDDAERFRESRRVAATWPLLVALLTAPVVVLSWVFSGPAGGLFVGVPLAAVVAFVAAVRLTTVVDDDGLHVRLWPVHRSARRVRAGTITAVERLNGSPAARFGGIGVRFRPTAADGLSLGAVAYLVGGDESGVRIERADGRPVVVGTERPDDLTTALSAVREG